MRFKIITGGFIPPWAHWLAMLLVSISASLVVLVIAGAGLDAPAFAMDATGGQVVPVDYPWWREVSDGLAGRKYAVLTFDDGPYGYGADERVLDILHRHRAHAIFFLLCGRLNRATTRVLGEISKNGNIVANHSYDHPHLTTLNVHQLNHQIDGCSDKLASASGVLPHYFRPPFGQTSAMVRAAIRSAGMQQMLWNANSEDSWQTKPDQILYWSLQQTKNGSILLMHDKPATADVLDRVLTQLERRGFQFVLPESSQSGHAKQE